MWAIKLSFDLEMADSSVTGFLEGPPVLIAGGIAEAVVLLAVAGRDGAGGAIPTGEGHGRFLTSEAEEVITKFGIEDTKDVEVTDVLDKACEEPGKG